MTARKEATGSRKDSGNCVRRDQETPTVYAALTEALKKTRLWAWNIIAAYCFTGTSSVEAMHTLKNANHSSVSFISPRLFHPETFN